MDWSKLAEDYARLGSLRKVAKEYRTRDVTVRAELARQGIPIKTRGHMAGTKKSAEWREKQRRNNWDNPEWREKQRAKWLERLPTMNGSAANSPLERILQAALIKAGISFGTQHKKLGKYVVDIEIDQAPVIIEADGARHVRNQERDAKRDAELEAAGYRVFRFNGKQINNDPDGCVRQVIETCNLKPDQTPRADIRNGMVGPDNPRWSGGKVETFCEVCGKPVLDNIKAWKGKPRRVCSNECQHVWQREAQKALWQDPEQRAKRLKGFEISHKDPEINARRIAGIKAAAQRPEVQAKKSASLKAWHARRKANP